jgi:hypothetical protein
MSPDSRMPQPKRTAPPKVSPVLLGGVRYEALHWGRSRGLGQNGGYIAAVDPGTKRELWILKVYDVAYDGKMEEDVQDIFIKKMKAQGGNLAVTDEDGRHYLVDPVTRTVTAE